MTKEVKKLPTLYYNPDGPPSRHVLLTAKVLKIDLNLILIDYFKGEQYTEEFLQINPAHQVPVLKDDNFILTESRAIMTYLAENFAKNTSLYPNDIQIQAKINQLYFFEMQTLLSSLSAYYSPIFFGAKEFNKEKLVDIENAMKLLDHFLSKTEYVASNNLTLADLAVVSTVATAVFTVNYDIKPFKNIFKWFTKLQNTLPGFKEIIEKYCIEQKEIMKQFQNKM